MRKWPKNRPYGHFDIPTSLVANFASAAAQLLLLLLKTNHLFKNYFYSMDKENFDTYTNLISLK